MEPLEKGTPSTKHQCLAIFWIPCLFLGGVFFEMNKPLCTSKEKSWTWPPHRSARISPRKIRKKKQKPTFFRAMALFPTFWEVCMCLKIMSSKIHPFKHSNLVLQTSYYFQELFLFYNVWEIAANSWWVMFLFPVGPPCASVFPSAESLSSSLSFMSVLRKWWNQQVPLPCNNSWKTFMDEYVSRDKYNKYMYMNIGNTN